MTIHSKMPAIGLGTYMMSPEEAEEMTYEAIKVGYRHIDTAEVYRNEQGVAKGIERSLSDGIVSRSDLFITTKVFPGNEIWGQNQKTFDDVMESFDHSLKRLKLDYVDLYLIHSPHAKGKRIIQWESLLSQQEKGKIKHIGVSNWGIDHIEEIVDGGYPLPAANQIELHPWSQKPELVSYLESKNIEIIAYSSLVPLTTWRHKKGEDSLKTEQMYKEGEDSDSLFKILATKYNVTEAQILLKWAIQLDYAILPKSINVNRMQNNFDLSFNIDSEDMELIKNQDKGGSITWAYGDPLKIS